MSEERFNRIDERLDRLETGQRELQHGLAELQHGQGELRNGQSGLRQGQAELRSDLNELKLHMSVLHEDAISRIAAIPEYTGPTKAEFAELKEMIGRRLDPLEATVRHHTAEIERLKETRG